MAADFDHREMIRPHGVLKDVESKIALFRPARLGQPLEHDGYLRIRRDVDVRYDHDGPASRRRRRLTNGQCFVRSLVVAADPDALEPGNELGLESPGAWGEA